MLFWAICATLSVVTIAMVLTPLLRRPPSADINPDTEFYKAQLQELDHDHATGLIDADAAATSRTEIARRLIAADKQVGRTVWTRRPLIAGIAATAVVIGTFATYASLGAAGYGDVPLGARHAAAEQARLNRPSQAAMQAAAPPLPLVEVSAEDQRTFDQLRQIVPNRPNDQDGWRLLALHEGNLRNFGAAAAAQAHLVGLLGDDVVTEELVYLADMLVAAAGGLVSSEAEAVADQIMARDPKNPAGLYYKGAVYYQTDRADIAFRLWRGIVAEGDPSSFHVSAARSQIQDAAFLAGEDKYTVPPAAGPTAQDIENASDMSPEDRQAMIAAMVSQLADRLATDGGTAAEWARLIAAQGVLGNLDQARDIYAEAIGVFGSSDAALTILRAAAEQAGITP